MGYKDGDEIGTSRNPDDSTAADHGTSQGLGVQKCGPSKPHANEGHRCTEQHSLNSEVGFNRQQNCEHFLLVLRVRFQPTAGFTVRASRNDCSGVEGSYLARVAITIGRCRVEFAVGMQCSSTLLTCCAVKDRIRFQSPCVRRLS